jgi:predicted cupin superfamily sugar epimerase
MTQLTTTNDLVHAFAFYYGKSTYFYFMIQQGKVADYISGFSMVPHPEGGYYASTYRHDIQWNGHSGIGMRVRPLATAIYYLLPSGQVSRLHHLLSDEIWFYHDGCPLVIHTFPPEGEYTAIHLGLDVCLGHVPQVVLSPKTVFGAEPAAPDSFCLVSCVVVPGFDFADFSFADKDALKERYPLQSQMIDRLG